MEQMIICLCNVINHDLQYNKLQVLAVQYTNGASIMPSQLDCIQLLEFHCIERSLTWLVKYPSAKDDNIHPCQCSVHPNSSVIGMMAIGMRTLSAAFIKFAAEHKETIILMLRDVKLLVMILTICYDSSNNENKPFTNGNSFWPESV